MNKKKSFFEKVRKILLKKRNRGLLVYFMLALIFLILLIIFRTRIASFVTTTVLIILGILSGQIKRMTGNIHIGVGFVAFANIMFLQTHGIVFTLIACFVMMMTSSILVGNVRPSQFVTYMLFIGTALLSLFLNFSVFVNSIILLLVYNIVGFFIMTFMGFNITKNFIFAFGSILFNYFLFKYFGDIVYSLLV